MYGTFRRSAPWYCAQQTCEGLGGGCEGVVGRADQQDAADRGGRLQGQDAHAGADALQGQGQGHGRRRRDRDAGRDHGLGLLVVAGPVGDPRLEADGTATAFERLGHRMVPGARAIHGSSARAAKAARATAREGMTVADQERRGSSASGVPTESSRSMRHQSQVPCQGDFDFPVLQQRPEAGGGLTHTGSDAVGAVRNVRR